MTHITIEREEAKRILHVINSGAGELRQLGLRLAGKTLEQALAAQHEPENEPYVSLASVQEPVGEIGWGGSVNWHTSTT